MISFWLGVGSSLMSVLIIFIVRNVYDKVRSKSDMSGNWFSQLYNDRGDVIKCDKLNLVHNKRTDGIKGEIERTLPLEQNYRKWKCQGIIKGDYLLLLFYSEQVIDSSGVALLKLQEDYKFVGKYMKWDRKHDSNQMILVDRIMEKL